MLENIIAVGVLMLLTTGACEWIEILKTKGILDALTLECADQLATQILLLKSKGLLKMTPGIKSDLSPASLTLLERRMSDLVAVFQAANKLRMADDVRWYFNFSNVNGQDGFVVRANLCLPVFFESKSTRNWTDRDCLGRILDGGGLTLAIHSNAFVPANANANIYESGYADSGPPVGFLPLEYQSIPGNVTLTRLTPLALSCGTLPCGISGHRP